MVDLVLHLATLCWSIVGLLLRASQGVVTGHRSVATRLGPVTLGLMLVAASMSRGLPVLRMRLLELLCAWSGLSSVRIAMGWLIT